MPLYTHARQFPQLAGRSDPAIRMLASCDGAPAVGGLGGSAEERSGGRRHDRGHDAAPLERPAGRRRGDAGFWARHDGRWGGGCCVRAFLERGLDQYSALQSHAG